MVTKLSTILFFLLTLNFLACKKDNPVTVSADFISDKNLVSEGDKVSYTDQSIGPVTLWSWNFEGGSPSISDAQNPEIVYSNSGKYDVKLNVNNGAVKDSLMKTDFIIVLPANELKSYFPFNGNSIDSIGGFNSVINNVVLDAGVDESNLSSYNFTDNGIIDINGGIIDLNQDFTITHWVFIDSLNMTDGYQYTVTSRHRPDGTEQGGVDIVIKDNSKIDVTFWKENPFDLLIRLNGNSALSTGTWHFIVLVRNGNIVSLYIDNQFDGSLSLAGIPLDNVDVWSLGAVHNIGYIFRSLRGKIDEVRFYQKGLSEEEIDLLYFYKI